MALQTPRHRPRPVPSSSHGLGPHARRYLRVRLNRLIGHLKRVVAMVDRGEDFTRIMTQLAAVRSGLTGVNAKMVELYVQERLQNLTADESIQDVLESLKFLARAY